MGEDDGTALVQLLKKDDIFGSGFVEDIFDFLIDNTKCRRRQSFGFNYHNNL